MATTEPPPAPVTPAAPVTPLPVTPIVTIPLAPPPGWKSSEAWLTFLAMLLGALPSSGLLTGAPLALKIVGIAATVLAALGYTTNRTSLKRAHLATATAAYVTPPPAGLASKLSATAAVMAVVTFLGAVAWGCGTTAQTIKQDLGSGADAFLACEKVNLAQDVNGASLLSVVANDLIAGNYEQAITDLIARLGNETIGCAVIAVETVVSAGKTSGAAALTPIELRAQELIKKYNWKVAPARPPAALNAPPPAPTAPPHAELSPLQRINGLQAWVIRATTVDDANISSACLPTTANPDPCHTLHAAAAL